VDPDLAGGNAHDNRARAIRREFGRHEVIVPEALGENRPV